MLLFGKGQSQVFYPILQSHPSIWSISRNRWISYVLLLSEMRGITKGKISKSNSNIFPNPNPLLEACTKLIWICIISFHSPTAHGQTESIFLFLLSVFTIILLTRYRYIWGITFYSRICAHAIVVNPFRSTYFVSF